MSYFNCPACISYAKCLVSYGALISQATLSLIQDLDDLQSLGVLKLERDKAKDPKKHEYEILEIRGLSLEDLQKLARASLEKTLQTRQGYFFSLLPRGWSQARVKFGGRLDSFVVELPQSGSVAFSLPYSCTYQGMSWFSGDGQFGGLRLTLRIERGWSYSRALEKLAQAQRYKDKVREVLSFTDQLESRGMVTQALLV